jgi:2-oxoacid:acceptor oxidoreductase gamma subunit (pyruvate/2-ketoisovalerate family)/2-oxoacid:acceptor oxidoreductase delta subunit (pyruvate/2-ketoisovalerate family)
MEIRLHGRGGQGGVTCAKIIAACYARLGKSVQTFGDYAGERSGAPVRAYTRVDDQPISNRNKVYSPDHIVVLDEHLLGSDTLAGLKAGGTLLLNTPRQAEELDGEWRTHRLATVDAREIARRHGIGTRSVVIVNTTIAGAFARVHGIPWEVLEETYRSLGFQSNLPAAREAWEGVAVREADAGVVSEAAQIEVAAPPPVEVEPIPDHVASGPTGIRTGSWSTQQPAHTEHLAPCSAWCPAGNDVVGFVRTLAAEGEEAASALLGRTTPLAAVCGRVCPAPCMEGCNRGEFDGSINIRGLERWIAEKVPVARREVATPAQRRRVAIVGGGPAGLAAAYELARAGHQVRLLEGEQRLGGVLTTGIPAYRLPREVIEREVEAILELGVEARCGTRLARDELAALASDHDALILATGLQRTRRLEVEGSTLEGVRDGLAFLRRVNLEGGERLSGHVVVLGGGNTAMDCARSALRAGAERVTVAYRRTRAEMPAIREEVEEALHEGVDLLIQRAPLGFSGNGRLASVTLAEVEMGEPDESGRRRPVVTDRVETLACDHVLLALGQSADLSLLPDGWELVEGRVHAGGQPTNVFAAGDVATGDGTVAHAIGSGRRAATRALRELGEDVVVFERPDRTKAVPVTDIRLDHFERVPPARDRLLPVEQRLRDFVEVDQGLGSALESHRCFSCGHCTRCDTCLVYCPEGIVRRHGGDYEVDYTYCKGCGICVSECPRKAMEMSTS